MEMTDGDPLSAALDTGWQMAFVSGEADVETRSKVTLTSTATQFRLRWQLQALERGEIVFERTGERDFDRDHL
ncbi:hypothetical protein [Ensifer canadensis]